MRVIRMNLFSLLVLLVIAAGCTESGKPITTSSPDVVSESDTSNPLADMIACETHAECSPWYCIEGSCNGLVDPKDTVITEDVVEDKSSCDSFDETDTSEETTEEIVEPQCSSNADCTDKDACYDGVCNWGTCIYTLAVECGENQACYETASGSTGCVYTCDTDAQCEDFHGNNPCTLSTCNDLGQCDYDYTDDATCDDGNACTTGDYCLTGVCNGGEQMDCPGECSDGACQDLCQVDSDCPPSDDPCVNVSCNSSEKLPVKECAYWYKGEAKFCDLENGEQGKCYNFQCVEYECSSSDHCDDGDACTQNLCTAGQCVYVPQACECQTNYECNDYNSCTDDICLMGTCQNPAIPGAVGNVCGAMAVCQENGYCVPVQCISDSDCADNNPCTNEWCDNNTCGFDTDLDCLACDSDVECDDGDDCTVDTCSGGTCSFDDECFYGEGWFKSLMCETDADCAGSEFGDFCVESGLNIEDYDLQSLSLCQPCIEYGVDMGCDDGSICTWGISSSQVGIFVSVFGCEEIVCESSEDCDDGDPCTQDNCHTTFCSNTEKDFCFPCDSNAGCESNSWCDNSSGGVHIEYPVCDADGTCQVDYWASTLDFTTYGCQYPLNCDLDDDCPMSGSCMFGSCYYANPADDFVYPVCNDDSNCEFGDCDFETGTCVEWECYGVDNGDGTLTVKLCPVGMACQNNDCFDSDLVALNCNTNTDCALVGLGNYCLADLVTAENTCYQCDPDSEMEEGYNHGCTSAQPFCGWVDDAEGYECLECYSDVSCDDGQVCSNNKCEAPLEEGACYMDDDCGPWQECNDGFCAGYGPIHCQFDCPEEGEFDWQNVNTFHGANEMTTFSCGEYWVVSKANLCLWGEEYPTYSVNLDDGEWEWGGGLETTITCNYPTEEVPDPTPAGIPGVTKGDLGVNLVTVFTDNTCVVSD